MRNLRFRGVRINPTVTCDLVDRAQNRHFQRILPPCIRPITTLANGTARLITRLASQGITATANSNLTTDGAASPNHASKAKTNAARNPIPASQAAQPPGSTGADADDDGDGAPESKRPVDVDTKDGKKVVTPMKCQWFARANLCIKGPVVQLELGVAPVDPQSGMVGQRPTASVESAYRQCQSNCSHPSSVFQWWGGLGCHSRPNQSTLEREQVRDPNTFQEAMLSAQRPMP